MERDRHEEARKSLNKLRSGRGDEIIDLEFREIRDVILADRAQGDINWKSIITKPTWRKRLILGCGVQFFGPLSGINVINYYGKRIFLARPSSERGRVLTLLSRTPNLQDPRYIDPRVPPHHRYKRRPVHRMVQHRSLPPRQGRPR